MDTADPQAASYIELTGVVQGVGFRPFVYNLALEHGLRGWVRNTSAGVQIEVEGFPGAVEAFARDLVAKAPPLARIESISVRDIAPNGVGGFAILQSQPQAGAYQLVSPDIATCDDCLRELFDPQDRRERYPFINCTNCGPRFTIIKDIPYDRPKTTMYKFPMCPDCQAEYDNPTDRRFHAQPNACPVCGPHLRIVEQAQPEAQCVGDQAVIERASALLKLGATVAVKGLGGFQLACDATSVQAVQRLRGRKRRPHKPFALMMTSMDEIRRHCFMTPDEERLLTSAASPIVLLRWRDGSSIVRGVAPNSRYLGVMLPYTPLHHLLLREVGRPLVMTSGNLSEEPIAKDNDEALRRLEGLADAFLLHNRDIHSRYDDSVWFVPLSERPQPIRRARGYAPFPVRLGFPVGQILACGAELKNTFCLTRDQYAFVSQHIGDMENLETLTHFETTVELYEHLFRAKPAAIACDRHPDYMATRYAQERAQTENLPLFCIQHHHAHITSCLADNDWPHDGGPVIGIALDGTGLGSDGHIWGGEFLIADYRSFRRFGHLQYLPLPGGDTSTRRPYRIAAAYLQQCLGEIPNLPFLDAVPQREIQIVQQMVSRGINTPLTSSCGRLFDAVSALLGIRLETSYEAQAAIELEMAAGDPKRDTFQPYPFSIEKQGQVHVLRLDTLLQAIVSATMAGTADGEISASFHITLTEMTSQMCRIAREETGLSTVALSGGCFQNRQLLRLTVDALQAQGFRVLLHRQVPCNDGGLSLGQAVIAHFLNGGSA
ncbi:MAG: carbamoyltransferase HypF [Anaerolineae bacterium SM23_84]|nr:MAG: carbamoyltransferase HypF [Anaerolineae bacterium SM23_84]